MGLLTVSGKTLSAQVVLLPNDEPILERESITRQDLARILVSYFPERLLVLIAGSRPVPDHKADSEEIWDFLDRTDILPRFSDGSSHSSDTVRRNHLAIVLQRIIRRLDRIPRSDTLAEAPIDVPPSRYDHLPIRLVITVGLMRTDANGRFRPDDPLSGRTAIEAVTSLSRLSSTSADRIGKNP
jgi:hypothetical protein